MSNFSTNGCVCVADINECTALMACENAKYECKNNPGSYECICKYKDSKGNEGCGTFTYDSILRIFNKTHKVEPNYL